MAHLNPQLLPNFPSLSQLVKKCNETARSMERMEKMLTLSRLLDFTEVRRTVPLISASRWLVRDADVDCIRNNSGWVQRQSHRLLLFTDMLLITRRQRFARCCFNLEIMYLIFFFSAESYLVADHCPRNLVQLSKFEDDEGESKSMAWIKLIRNHEDKMEEWLVSFRCVSYLTSLTYYS